MGFYDFPYICIYVYIYIGNVIIPTDGVIFFRGVETTPTGVMGTVD